MDQGSNKNHSPAYNFAPTVTKFCVMWEGLSLPHDTKFGNCRCKIVDSRAFPSWSLIHGLRWSGLIKAEPGLGNGVLSAQTKFHLFCMNRREVVFNNSDIYHVLIIAHPHSCGVTRHFKWKQNVSQTSQAIHMGSYANLKWFKCNTLKSN